MFKCRLADLNISFDSYSSSLEYLFSSFKSDFSEPDLCVPISHQDILNERELYDGENENLHDVFFEETAAFRNLGEKLPQFDAVIMHSCLIDVNDLGVAFTARSGTGKTTHMMLWKETLKQQMTVVNGDKPIVRFVDGDLYAYGTPWAGKENLYINSRVPLRHICKIERSKDNRTVQMSKEEGALLLMQQVYMPKEPVMLAKTIRLINRIVEKVDFWTVYCNMDKEAALTAQSAILGDNFFDVVDKNKIDSSNEISFAKTQQIKFGYWTPKVDTTSFTISGLPFKPIKFSLFCNDIILLCHNNKDAYYISCNIDFNSGKCMISGMVNTSKGAIPYAIGRHHQYCKKVEVFNDGITLNELIMNDISFVFATGKTYTWIAMAEE